MTDKLTPEQIAALNRIVLAARTGNVPEPLRSEILARREHNRRARHSADLLCAPRCLAEAIFRR
jgi:hypothetical protein